MEIRSNGVQVKGHTTGKSHVAEDPGYVVMSCIVFGRMHSTQNVWVHEEDSGSSFILAMIMEMLESYAKTHLDFEIA